MLCLNLVLSNDAADNALVNVKLKDSSSIWGNVYAENLHSPLLWGFVNLLLGERLVNEITKSTSI
jgi:hypothetical protein